MTDPSNSKPSSALDHVLVATIRAMAKVGGRTPTQISTDLEIPRTTVRDVIKRRTWSHLPVGLLAWEGEHPRHGEAYKEACGASHPDRPDVWCWRGIKHKGGHMWLPLWEADAEDSMFRSEISPFVTLEILAIIEEEEAKLECSSSTSSKHPHDHVGPSATSLGTVA